SMTASKVVVRSHMLRVVAIALFAISVVFVSFAVLHSIYALCVSAFIIGIGYGTLFPALQTIYINMAPNEKRGTANSTYLTGFDLGIGIGMLLGAYLGDHYGFSQMYLITAGLCLIALFMYWFNSRKVFEKHRLR